MLDIPQLNQQTNPSAQTPQKRLASPIRFTVGSAGVDPTTFNTTPLQSSTSQVSLNNYPQLSPPSSTLVHPSSSAKKTTTKDVRPTTGRVGSLGLQQLFPQRDPATINAVVSAAAGVPFTPPPSGVVVPSHDIAEVADSPAPNLVIDG